jgi:translation initiation factor 1
MARDRPVYDTAVGRLDRCSFCRRRAEACVCPNRGAGGREVPGRDGVVRVSRDRKGRRGKTVTVVTGLPLSAAGLTELVSSLKRLCGSGGTVTDEGNLEIQGDHRERVAARLTELGYRVKLAGG